MSQVISDDQYKKTYDNLKIEVEFKFLCSYITSDILVKEYEFGYLMYLELQGKKDVILEKKYINTMTCV